MSSGRLPAGFAGRKGHRRTLLVCGWIMVGCVLALAAGMYMGRRHSLFDRSRSSTRPTDQIGGEIGNVESGGQPEHDRIIKRMVLLLVAYVAMAYAIVPVGWKHYIRGHALLEGALNITRTADGIKGDPLNIALVGTEESIKGLMLAARWRPADPITVASCFKIAAATLTRRSYEDAPVSNLYLWGRKQDLAFEQPVGGSPQRRHHVRFWRSEKTDARGRPIWVGAATYDKTVGFSHMTGQITHHTAADIDTERNVLFEAIRQTGRVAQMFVINSFHKKRKGRNGGGDPWHTDGRLFVAVIDTGSEVC